MSSSSTSRGVLPGASLEPVGDAKDMGVDGERRFAKSGVEDDIGGLAADPGQSFERVAVLRGLAAMLLDIARESAMTFLALAAIKPDRLDNLLKPDAPSATIVAGVSAIANSRRVALLTPVSVACADSTTATSKVKGLRNSSSPFGSGRALASRSKIASALPALALRDALNLIAVL